MKPGPFELVLPDSVAAAHAALAAGGDRAVLLAGGQSLVPKLSQRLVRPGVVVCLGRIAALRRIEQTEAALHLGAGVTYADIEDLPERDRLGAIMSGIVAGIGSRGVRNRATIAGCLANGDPQHDWMVALPALGARIRLETSSGAREVVAADWLPQPFRPALRGDEIIVATIVPKPGPPARWGYAKLSQKMNAGPLALAAVLVEPEAGRANVVIGCAAGVTLLPDLGATLVRTGTPPHAGARHAAIRAAYPAADPRLHGMLDAVLADALTAAMA